MKKSQGKERLSCILDSSTMRPWCVWSPSKMSKLVGLNPIYAFWANDMNCHLKYNFHSHSYPDGLKAEFSLNARQHYWFFLRLNLVILKGLGIFIIFQQFENYKQIFTYLNQLENNLKTSWHVFVTARSSRRSPGSPGVKIMNFTN